MKSFKEFYLLKEESVEDKISGLNAIAHPAPNPVGEILKDLGMFNAKVRHVLGKHDPALANYIAMKLMDLETHLKEYGQH